MGVGSFDDSNTDREYEMSWRRGDRLAIDGATVESNDVI